MLQTVCGFEYTAKLQRMFQDIGISRDLNDQFLNYLQSHENAKIDFEFAVLVLSTGAWPTTNIPILGIPLEASYFMRYTSIIVQMKL